METTIIPAVPADALALIDVQNQAFYDDFRQYGDCPSYQEPETRMREMIEQAIVKKIVAVNTGEIIGDLIARRRENGIYYLRVIAVIPRFWNQGVGTRALTTLEQQFPDATKWTLVTPHRSFRNHHFYEKLGYRKMAEHVHSEKLTLWEYEKPFRNPVFPAFHS